MQALPSILADAAATPFDFLASLQIEVCLVGIAVLLYFHIQGSLAKSSEMHGVLKKAPKVEYVSSEPPMREFAAEIKTCGELGDMERVWALWSEMRAQQVPTQASLTTMVDALVSNDFTPEAWKLANDEWQGELYLVGGIAIYSSLLRGFSRSKQHREVLRVFEEMHGRDVQMNTITYNRVLHSVVCEERWHQLPVMLCQMKASGPRSTPDSVTYSTIIKGYCQAGDVDAGLQVLSFMRKEEVKPDEFTYNSLLEGCVHQRRLSDGLALLDQMSEGDVAPSNYTVSIVIKLLGRFRRLQQCFDVAEGMSKAYGFQLNIQVYTCLMQACFHSRRIGKAFELHNRVVSEGHATVDRKTYTVLARGCLQAGAPAKAAMVVLCAYHLPGSGSLLPSAGRPQGLEPSILGEVISELASKCPESAAQLEAALAGLEAPTRLKQVRPACTRLQH